MGYKVYATHTARNGFENSVEYIFQILRTLRTAARLIHAFGAIVDDFEKNSAFYPKSISAAKPIGRDVYYRNIDSYRVYFVVDPECSAATVFSFLHKRQDLSMSLREDCLSAMAWPSLLQKRRLSF